VRSWRSAGDAFLRGCEKMGTGTGLLSPLVGQRHFLEGMIRKYR
jgi:hypothetical protein